MSLLFAWRYFKAKKTTNAINIISWISIVAIVFGTAALILVLSVFNGFEGLVKSLYSSFYPEIKISAAAGKQLTLTQEQINEIRAVKGIKAVSMVVEERALLQNQSLSEDSIDFQSIVIIKGVDQNYPGVNKVQEHIIQGEFEVGDADNPALVLGIGIQNALAVQSDRNVRPLAIYLPRKDALNLNDPLNSLSVENINTAGTFMIQQDFDNQYALTNLGFMKKMMGLPENSYTAAEISVFDPSEANASRDLIRKVLGANYKVQNRFEQNASLYSVMRIEKWIIYAILALILIVASFNMVGALTMLVLEKKQDISTLHALGASRSFIQRIFLTEGILLAIIGGSLGMMIAFVFGRLQQTYHLIPLEGNSFMINYFPVKMVVSDFLLVGLTVVVIAFGAAFVPARKAAQRQFQLRNAVTT